MAEKSVLSEIIEENYQFLKYDIIRVKGSACMLGDLCRDTIMMHSKQIVNADAKAITLVKDKVDFICDKLDELYKYFLQDYPNPMEKEY